MYTNETIVWLLLLKTFATFQPFKKIGRLYECALGWLDKRTR